jgi:hypothetical protein
LRKHHTELVKSPLAIYVKLLLRDAIALLSGIVGVLMASLAYTFWHGQISRLVFLIGSLASLQLASFRVWYNEHNQRLKTMAAISGPMLDVEFMWHFGTDRADTSIGLRNSGDEDAFNIHMSDMANGTRVAKFSSTIIPRVPKGETVGCVPDEVVTQERTVSPGSSGWGVYGWTIAFFVSHNSDECGQASLPLTLKYEDRFGRKYVTVAAIDYHPSLKIAQARFIQHSTA